MNMAFIINLACITVVYLLKKMFIMNGKSNFWVCLFVMAAGIALICMHSDEWLVVVLGWLFALPGALVILLSFLSKTYRRYSEGINLMSAIGSLMVGIIMIVWPAMLVGVLVYVLAALLVFLGIWQIVSLVKISIPVMPWWLYVLPALSLGAGIALLVTPLRTIEELFTLVSGIAMVCVGANGVFMAVTSYTARREHLRAIDNTDNNRPENY